MTNARHNQNNPAAIQPLVSVIVPAHNRISTIKASIASLLEQDFAAPLEVIVVDDGSTDGTAAAVNRIDPRVRVVCQPQRGAAVARYRGVLAARAPLVAFQDSDDISYPDRITQLVAALKRHPLAVAAFAFSKERSRNELRCWQPPASHQVGSDYFIKDPLPLMIRYGTISTGMNLLTYRNAALRAGEGLSFYRAANDYAFQIGLARLGSLVCLPRILCEYEFQAGGITRLLGPTRQRAYLLCAAEAAWRSERRSVEVDAAIRDLAKVEWGPTVVNLARLRQWRLLMRVFGIGVRHVPIRHALRSVWWQLDVIAESDAPKLSVYLAGLVNFLRRCRDVRRTEGAQ